MLIAVSPLVARDHPDLDTAMERFRWPREQRPVGLSSIASDAHELPSILLMICTALEINEEEWAAELTCPCGPPQILFRTARVHWPIRNIGTPTQ
jgi:hypothetical protein